MNIGHEHVVANLDSFSERVNELRWLRAESQVELPPPFHFGGATQDALLPSVLDRAFKRDL